MRLLVLSQNARCQTSAMYFCALAQACIAKQVVLPPTPEGSKKEKDNMSAAEMIPYPLPGSILLHDSYLMQVCCMLHHCIMRFNHFGKNKTPEIS